MNHLSSFLKKHAFLCGILLLYWVASMWFLKFYQYQLNPDGISYISIAQKYVRGDFSNAVNGYWGPLLSWLLVPFLYFRLDPLISIKLLSSGIGFFIILGMYFLSFRFEINQITQKSVLLSLIPIVIYFSFCVITPDLLLACIIIYYLFFIFNKNFLNHRFYGISCGLIGAAAYFAKAYAFPFFVVHFTLFHIFYFLKCSEPDKTRKTLFSLASGLLLFFLLIGGWVWAISHKYQEITIGTAGRSAYALVGPESQGSPVHYVGFRNPPTPTASSAWEDPTYLKMKPWSPFQSWNFFKYQINLLISNISFVIFTIFQSFSYLTLITICSNLIYFFSLKKLFNQETILFPAATLALFCSGYCLSLVEERYLFFTCFLLLLMTGYLLSQLLEKIVMNRIQKTLILFFFWLSFVVTPSKFLFQAAEGSQPDLNTLNKIYQVSQLLETQYHIKGNLASDTHWHLSFYVSYHLNSTYFGEEGRVMSDEELETELHRYHIEYFLVWEGEARNPKVLSKYKLIALSRELNFRIYDLKQSSAPQVPSP